MNVVTKKIFNISKIATNVKSVFTMDLNSSVYRDKTTVEQIIYIKYNTFHFSLRHPVCSRQSLKLEAAAFSNVP